MKMKKLLAVVLSTAMLLGCAMVAHAAEPARQMKVTPVFSEGGKTLDIQVDVADFAIGDYAVAYLTGVEIGRDHDLSDGYHLTYTVNDFIANYGYGPDVFAFTIEINNANGEVRACRSYYETIKVYDGGMHKTATKKNFSTAGMGSYGSFNDGVAKLVNNYALLKDTGAKAINGSCNSRASLDANGYLVIDTCEALGFNYSGATAVSTTNTPITVIFTYNETYYQFVIPPKFNVESYLDKYGNVGFLYLSEQLGRYQLVNGAPVLVIPAKVDLSVPEAVQQ